MKAETGTPQDYKIIIELKGDDSMDLVMDESKNKISQNPDGGRFDVGKQSTLLFERM